MGKKDEVLAIYLEDKARYADLVDGLVFGGQRVVKPEDIQERDTRAAGVKGKSRKRTVVQKYRDMIRNVAMGVTFVIIALEHQNQIHFAMPVRVMMSDATEYDKQMRKIQRRHHREQDLKGAEYLGGFARADRLHPIVTLVLYYGDEPWDGPKDLYEMMDWEELPEALRSYVNHYPIHVIEVKRLENLDVFQTDLREVFGFVQCAKDKNAAREYVNKNQESFQKMDEDAFDVIATLTNSDELWELKEQYQEEGGINMCQAIREMIEDGRIEGRVEGRVEGRDRINELNRRLLEEGREQDMIRAIRDLAYQDDLLKEYQL